MHDLTIDLNRLKDECDGLEIGQNSSYCIIPNFKLPDHTFNRSQTRLLIEIPPTFPIAPPDNFYVNWGLAPFLGGQIENYSGPVMLHGEQWGTFSFHVQDGGWDSNNDNLLTFVTAIRGRLQEGK